MRVTISEICPTIFAPKNQPNAPIGTRIERNTSTSASPAGILSRSRSQP